MYTPKISLHFYPPPSIGDNDEDEDNTNLLKLASQEKYNLQDLVLLTKMDVTIPMKTLCLKHNMKNYTGCTWRYLGKDYIAHTSLKALVNHMEDT